MASPESPRFWAFISYSSKDVAAARWLHRAIETYGIPTQLAGKGTPTGDAAPKRFHPVFKDREDLSAGSDLTAQVVDALKASRYLIVLCSPNSAASKWVNKEVETFISLGRKDRVLALILDGNPPDCFPPALRGDEPIAADAREQGDGKNNAKLKLLAGMLGVSFDALKQRDAQRRIRRLQIALSGVVLLLAIFGALAWYANNQRLLARTSEAQAKEALANSDFREGVSRLRAPETTAEGIAFLARAARTWNGHDRARARLWTLLQQRRFWVEAPGEHTLPDETAEFSPATVAPGATVDFQGKQMAISGSARSDDGKLFVTWVNDEIETIVHHFRIESGDRKPLTDWIEIPLHNLDVRDIAGARFSSDGRWLAIIGHVWREPQIIEIFDLKTFKENGDPIRATGLDPNFQEARFTHVRFLPPRKNDPETAHLLTATSRGDAMLFNVEEGSVSPIGEAHHAAAVTAVSVDDDYRWMVSGSADQQVRVWDIQANEPLGGTIALPDAPTHAARVGEDRVRVKMPSGEREYTLLPAIIAAVPSGSAIPQEQRMTDDERADDFQAVSLARENQVIAQSPDGKRSVRLVDRGQIEVSGEGGATWRHRVSAAVWKARFQGDRLILQTNAFTTQILNAATGERIGPVMDESRNFVDAVRPSKPLSSTLGGAGNVVLTRSFFWDPPNVAHHWFTVWDLTTGLPLMDAEHVADTGFAPPEQTINYAALSPDESRLLLGGDAKVVRCIELSPPAALETQLPNLAEAFGGLKVEQDGTFSAVPDQLKKIRAIVGELKQPPAPTTAPN